MTKPKLRGSWGGKIEAQGGLGVAKPKLNRASESIRGRSRDDPGVGGGVRGGPLRIFGGDLFFCLFPGVKNYETLWEP